MNNRLKLTLGSIALVLLSACGGGGDDKEDSVSTVQNLWGVYYSASTNVVWQFASNAGQSGRYKGVMYQGSTDGSACRITYLDYSVNSSGSTVTSYITQAIGSGNNNTYNSSQIYDGPYSAGYTLTSNGATIGAGTYTNASSTTFRPNRCR
jgi:hypothetical protein